MKKLGVAGALGRELSRTNRLKFRKENPIAGVTHQELGFLLTLVPSKGLLGHCGIATQAAGIAGISHHLHLWTSWWRRQARMSSLGSSPSSARLLVQLLHCQQTFLQLVFSGAC